jgi:hypothetical protein
MAENQVQDLNALEGLISKLQVAYEQYLAGALKKEPLDIVRQIEDSIRALGRTDMRNPAISFRFNSLRARYNSYKHVWEKRARQKIEGAAPPKPWGVKPATREGDTYTGIIPEGPLQDRQATDIFNHYIDLRKKCNEPVDKIRAENFKAILSENISKLRQRTGCKTVAVRVDIQDQRSRISAKPFEE